LVQRPILHGDCKWSGIAAGADGRLYCAPCHAPCVLVIAPGAAVSNRGDDEADGVAGKAALSHIPIPSDIIDCCDADQEVLNLDYVVLQGSFFLPVWLSWFAQFLDKGFNAR
jgi:hypothetical protein